MRHSVGIGATTIRLELLPKQQLNWEQCFAYALYQLETTAKSGSICLIDINMDKANKWVT